MWPLRNKGARTFAGWKMLEMTNNEAFMDPFGGLFEVIVPFYTRHIERREKVSTSVIRTISLIRYHSMGALDKGVRIIEVALYIQMFSIR